MSISSSIRNSLVPIHKAGYPFIAIGLAATVGLSLVSVSLAWIAAIVTVWAGYFFRNPPRTTPVEDGIVVAPAEGHISMIAEVLPPRELNLPPEPMLRVSVFMSIFDCHVNRTPVSGRIKTIAYTPGRFFSADLDKASDHNERNALAIETPYGLVVFVQIAGLIARRIEHWVAEGDRLEVGDRFGLIRFGSRIDVYLPLGTPLCVTVGQTAIVGETVLARLTEGKSTRRYKTS
ncbi:phosphatidylserine decarboxylase [Aurantiacibacter xanthus]|uniref:Phosphatidylserine decarboxylase proenzyme n=1 Tax=Aurantiacibacter xanthus TaxID=1784712 RepID=A0A3A1P3G6_9SPHN|nr:phosphatidylserine decarboxylase [Aurantiacibacter xanthus]RIV85477.1 phosphatidylserine decarboxylase [Aurantiacibacter xanthus]